MTLTLDTGQCALIRLQPLLWENLTTQEETGSRSQPPHLSPDGDGEGDTTPNPGDSMGEMSPDGDEDGESDSRER